MTTPSDTTYYLSDATVREVRKALDCLFIAVDESIAGEVSAKVRAGFEAVARVAEARGRADAATGGTMNEVRTAVERGSDYCHDSTRWFEKEGVWDTYFAPIFNVMPESP